MNLLEDTNQNDQIQIDENKDYFAELTAPGAKFDLTKYDNDPLKAAAAIAKGKWHADATLDHRNKSFDELREDFKRLKSEYDAGPSLKELIDQFKSSKESNNDNTQIVNEDKSALDMTKIEELVQSKIQQTKQLEKEEQNYNQVQAKLIEAYGPNYVQSLKQQISQLGLTSDFVNDLARKHPNVLFKTLGLDGQRQTETFQAPLKSTNQVDHFGSNTPKRTWSYYEKIRKSDPTRYFDPKTQDQMFKDAVSLGESFNDGDFQKRFAV